MIIFNTVYYLVNVQNIKIITFLKYMEGTFMSSNFREEKLKQLKEQNNSQAKKTLISLFDESSFSEIDPYYVSGSVIAGFGSVDGNPTYAFIQNIDVKSGAVDERSVSKIRKIYDLAFKTGTPIVSMYDSNGASLDDDHLALMSYGSWMADVNNLSGVVPQISVVLGTCAGSAAMIACSGDLVIMNKDANLYLTAPCISGQKADAKSCEESGLVHMVCENTEGSIETTRNILAKLPLNNLSSTQIFDFQEPSNACDESKTGIALIESVCDEGSAIHLQKDFSKCFDIALATVMGNVTGFVATTKDVICGNGALKVSRFVRFCDAFSIPVVTFMGAKGICCESSRSDIKSISALAHSYAEATTAKISVITDEVCGSPYIAIAGKGSASDLSFAWSGSSISTLPAKTLVEMFWHDKLKEAEDLDVKRSELAKEYKDEKSSPFAAASKGCIDGIIEAEDTRITLISALDMLSSKRISKTPKKHGNIPL